MPPQPQGMPAPQQQYGVAIIAGAVVIVIAALALIAWLYLRGGSDQAPAQLSNDEKLQILQQLSASGTGSATPAEKQDALTQLRATVDTSEGAKMDVMQSLQAN